MVFTFYDPANGVPNMPTESSAQMRNSTTRRTPQITIRNSILFTFLITSSHISPVPSSSAAMTIKSERVHFTSFVNCIAINGISIRSATVSTIPKIFLFFTIIIKSTLNCKVKNETDITKAFLINFKLNLWPLIF